jgi:predicted transcriptional regulator
MKDIVASLKPYYYYLIGEGIKKWEVRKNAPKAEDWSRKVNFYMSKDEKSFAKIPKEFQEKYRKHFGKVGLRVIVDWIDIIECDSNSHLYFSLNGTCLSQEEIRNYCKGQDLSAWHIYDKLLWDKPKELSEFNYPPFRDCDIECRRCKYGFEVNTILGKEFDCDRTVKRPPQSYMFVEELEGEN